MGPRKEFNLVPARRPALGFAAGKAAHGLRRGGHHSRAEVVSCSRQGEASFQLHRPAATPVRKYEVPGLKMLSCRRPCPVYGGPSLPLAEGFGADR